MSMSNTLRINLERAIVKALIEEAAKAGFVPVTVWNGEEYAPQGIAGRSRAAEAYVPDSPLTPEQAIAEVFSVDESTLHFAPANDLAGWGSLGVFLVGGNREDIISDWHCGNDAFSNAVEAALHRIENTPLVF
jgi:hypothetical protein